jgi:hypothetical protein
MTWGAQAFDGHIDDRLGERGGERVDERVNGSSAWWLKPPLLPPTFCPPSRPGATRPS